MALLDEADIVVSNPPFSLWREYVSTLVEYDKKFIIVGNKNAITYKEVFPLIKDNKMWIGDRSINSDFWLMVPDGASYEKINENGTHLKHIMACWFTNLDIKKMLAKEGKPRDEVARRFGDMVRGGPTLLVAHNAQFDGEFTRYLLAGQSFPDGLHWLDSMTVYKDRRPYPHCRATIHIGQQSK